ncbi:MFS transporter [Dactylosporangium sp. NPDC051484]|uniref:MFS transporter n=1 Tax=Dactylosporangium sp. NPDC051484 TaxID=3154942 RepID=UPI003450D04D
MNHSVASSAHDRTTAPAGPARDRFGARFSTPLTLGTILNPVNSSIIATALVPIAASLGVPVARTAILISALYLTSAIAQPTAGRLAEQFGARRVFVVGTTAVLIGGIVGLVATNIPTLTVSRVLIGLGTSAAYPSAMLLIRHRASNEGMTGPPTLILGRIAVISAAIMAFGPTLGGLLVEGLGWRAAFAVNLPLATITLSMAMLWLPKDPPRRRGRSARDVVADIDLLGLLLFAAMMTTLLVFLMGLPEIDGTGLAIAVVLAALLAAWELRSSNPFIDLRLLCTNGALSRTYLRNALSLVGTYSVLFGLTQWLQSSRGLSPLEAGMVLMPMGILSGTAAFIVSRRATIRWPLIASSCLLTLGALSLTLLSQDTPLPVLLIVVATFGLMGGSSNVGNQTALYREAPARTLGTAAGLLRTCGYLGSIGASTVCAIAFRTEVSDQGLHHVGYVLMGVGALLLLPLTLLDRRLRSEDASA